MLWVAIFFANAVVIVLEIVGARALTPFFGSSAEMWSGIISVVLLGLALGYWYGGILADRNSSYRTLLSVVIAAAGCIIVATWSGADALAVLVMHTIPYLGLTIATALAALFLLFIPSALLAAASPISAKALLTSLDTSATTVGRLSAVAATGSVAGSLGVGMVLVPYLGSHTTLIGAGVCLLIVASLLALPTKNMPVIALLGAVTLLAGGTNVLFSSGAAALVTGTLIADIDTRYNRIFVIDAAHAPGESFIRSVHTDPLSTQCAARLQSATSTPDPELPFAYSQAFDVAFNTVPDPESLLIIGGCNYSYPLHAAGRAPHATIDVVEIDEGMMTLAQTWFAATLPAHTHAIHADGRFFLNTLASTTAYDVVILDAFNSPLNTPFQLLTVEAFRAMRAVLNPNGVLVFNIIGSVTGPGSSYVASIVATLETVFPNVVVYQIGDSDPTKIQNFMVVASAQRSHTTGQEIIPEYQLRLTPLAHTALPKAGALVLTDTYAPVEQLTKPMRDSLFYTQTAW